MAGADAASPATTCREHLRLLRVPATVRRASGNSTATEVIVHPGRAELSCAIGWEPPQTGSPAPGSEATAQAEAGVMHVQGRDRGVPRRIGLDVASVASGLTAVQGILAALVARARGLDIRTVETSVLQSALLYTAHHLAIATCGDDFPTGPPAAGPGPPFPTADGRWVEIEVLSGDDWATFWRALGVDRAEVIARSWLPFVYRYLAGRCALPPELHAATTKYTVAQLGHAAGGANVALCPVRDHPLAADEPPWRIRPSACGPGTGSRPVAGTGGAPLAGIRVVEAGTRLQAPLASLLLCQLGAEVIKIEPPGGDIGRISPPLAGSVGAAYLAYNRGKRVEEVDYKRQEGQARLLELIGDADVFLHNWRHGRAERLGLDPDRLHRSNPRLVCAHASGWGTVAPPPSPIAGDFLVQAHAGLGRDLHLPGEPPFPSRVPLLDTLGGMLACEGILAALYHREQTGEGSRVETSLLGAAKVLRDGSRSSRRAWGRLDQPVQTGSGFVVVDAPDETSRRLLTEIVGARAADDASIIDRLRSTQAEEWLPRLRDADIPAALTRTSLDTIPFDPRHTSLAEPANRACWVPAAPWKHIR